MARVEPLRAIRYDPARVGDMQRVIAPPYDVIGSAEQETLYQRDPHNAVRLILAREEDRAAAAAHAFSAWLEEGVLAQDPEPAVYLYSQSFTLADGKRRTREGVICRLGLEEFSTGIVRPHERTFPGPKADRLRLLKATGAYMSCIFGLYARAGEPVRSVLGELRDAPVVDVGETFGATHRLWRITDPATIARWQTALAGETIFIADGHHRYETGLAYFRERGGPGTILAFLTNMADEGLVILPTHRLVRGPLGIDAPALERRLAEVVSVAPLRERQVRPDGAIDLLLPDRRLRLGITDAARARLGDLAPSVRRLDLSVLHRAILEPILGMGTDRLAFTHDDAEAERELKDGRASAAFLLNAPSVDAVRAVCLSGELMPEKSTYFFPKLASGLVFDRIVRTSPT